MRALAELSRTAFAGTHKSLGLEALGSGVRVASPASEDRSCVAQVLHAPRLRWFAASVCQFDHTYQR